MRMNPYAFPTYAIGIFLLAFVVLIVLVACWAFCCYISNSTSFSKSFASAVRKRRGMKRARSDDLDGNKTCPGTPSDAGEDDVQTSEAWLDFFRSTTENDRYLHGVTILANSDTHHVTTLPKPQFASHLPDEPLILDECMFGEVFGSGTATTAAVNAGGNREKYLTSLTPYVYYVCVREVLQALTRVQVAVETGAIGIKLACGLFGNVVRNILRRPAVEAHAFEHFEMAYTFIETCAHLQEEEEKKIKRADEEQKRRAEETLKKEREETAREHGTERWCNRCNRYHEFSGGTTSHDQHDSVGEMKSFVSFIGMGFGVTFFLFATTIPQIIISIGLFAISAHLFNSSTKPHVFVSDKRR